MRPFVLLVGIAVPAAVLGTAGALKLVSQGSFRVAVISWRIVPGRLVQLVAIALPAGEICIAVCAAGLLASRRLAVPALMISSTYFFLGAGQYFVLRRTPNASCGCTGTSTLVSRSGVARNAVLAALPVAAVAAIRARG